MKGDPREFDEGAESERTYSDPFEVALPDSVPGRQCTVTDENALLHRRIGNFEVLSLLGRGGFGSVYKARDTKLERDVAIKFLHRSLDSNRLRLFEREARALAALSREASILAVYEWGEIGSQHYIVLEFLDGSAAGLLKSNPHGLPVTRALAIAVDCAEALHAAHEAGILHRDVKPANILLNLATGRPKLADFGLARLAEDSGDFTLAGGISGSPPYMSPEQASAGRIDERSDIFSLGVTLYEFLCGQRPYIGSTPDEIMERIRKDERISLHARKPDLPGRVYAIIDKATAHEPERRYQTAGEFARELRNTLTLIENADLADTRPSDGTNMFAGRILKLLGCLAGKSSTEQHPESGKHSDSATPILRASRVYCRALTWNRLATALVLVSLVVPGIAFTWFIHNSRTEELPPANGERVEVAVSAGQLKVRNSEAPVRVAVLNFANNTAHDDLDWLRRGFCETASNELSESTSLTVLERSQIDKVISEIDFEQSKWVEKETAQEIGRLLGVDFVVLGSFQLSEDHLRVSVRKVDTGTGEIAAARTVDGMLSDLFELQGRVAQDVRSMLEGQESVSLQ